MRRMPTWKGVRNLTEAFAHRDGIVLACADIREVMWFAYTTGFGTKDLEDFAQSRFDALFN